MRRLNDAGVACGVLVAPVLPGLSDTDEQVTAVVEACRAAGAVAVSVVALHLRPGAREHYLSWLADVRPDLVDLHARRFRHGAYQPRREHERLSALVARVMGHTPAARSQAGQQTSPSSGGAEGDCRGSGTGPKLGKPLAEETSAHRRGRLGPDKQGQLALFSAG